MENYPPPPSSPPPPPAPPYGTHRSLHRSLYDRMFCGVCGGIAEYLELDVTLVRVIMVVLALFGGSGIALYIAGWLLMPEAGSSESVASKLVRDWQR